MQSHQELYETVKERVRSLQLAWKDASLQKTRASKTEPHGQDANGNRPQAGRRIKPTLVTRIGLPTMFDSKTRANPFASSNESNFPVSRPFASGNAAVSTGMAIPTARPAVVSNAGVKLDFAGCMRRHVDGTRMEMIDQLAAAYCLVVFDEVAVDFASFSASFGAILVILQMGHQMLSGTEWDESMMEGFLQRPMAESMRLECGLDTPLELFCFAVAWVRHSQERIAAILPEATKAFARNRLVEAADPGLARQLEMRMRPDDGVGGTGGVVSLHNLLPVAYSNQRDSRNFFADPTLHANQQKVRDLFLNLVRHFSTGQLDTTHPSFRRSFGARVGELMGRLARENHAWLAGLYLQEYMQAASGGIDRLEERMRPGMGGTFSQTQGQSSFSLDQIFSLFLQHADSFRLTRAVERRAETEASLLLDQANSPLKRTTWPECVRKLRALMRLIATCRYLMDGEEEDGAGGGDGGDTSRGWRVDEEDLFVFAWTQDAIINRHLLTLLPLLHEYFSTIGPEGIKSRCVNTVRLLVRYYRVKFERKRGGGVACRGQLLLRLALEDMFKELLPADLYAECVMSLADDETEESGERGECDERDERDERGEYSRGEHSRGSRGKPPRAHGAHGSHGAHGTPLCVDEDDGISAGGVYRSISWQLREICATLTMASGEVSSPPLLNAPPPRKVRPVTEVAAGDLRRQRLQRELRQWFWWRYAGQKELIDALTTYILEQLLFPRFSRTLSRTPTPVELHMRKQNVEVCRTQCREVLCGVLPSLLPSFWQEHAEMGTLLLGLSMERASKVIERHFSDVSEATM